MKSYNNKENIGHRLRTIVSDIQEYIEKRLELLALDIGENFSDWMATSVQRLIGAAFILLGICFALVALAIFLGKLIGSLSLGYVLVSVPLLILGLFLINLKPVGVFKLLQRHFDKEIMDMLNNRKSEESESEKLESRELLINEEAEKI